MADPFTMMAIGATAGAVLNPNDPIKGAVMGGALGYGGGALAGSQAAYGALPGVASGSQQAAMLAAQTGEFGVPGLLATGSAAAGAQGVSPMTSSLLNFGSKATTPGGQTISPMQQASVANQFLGRNQQAQQRMPNAPMVQTRPFTGMKLPVNAMQQEEERRRMMYTMQPMPQIRLI